MLQRHLLTQRELGNENETILRITSSAKIVELNYSCHEIILGRICILHDAHRVIIHHIKIHLKDAFSRKKKINFSGG